MNRKRYALLGLGIFLMVVQFAINAISLGLNANPYNPAVYHAVENAYYLLKLTLIIAGAVLSAIALTPKKYQGNRLWAFRTSVAVALTVIVGFASLVYELLSAPLS